jgi:hypothetical protein
VDSGFPVEVHQLEPLWYDKWSWYVTLTKRAGEDLGIDAGSSDPVL